MILTIDEVRNALNLDYDAKEEELLRYAILASSFIKNKTGYDFGAEEEKQPIAVECAIKYIQQMFYSENGYNKEFDFTLGINGMLVDLQNIATDKISEQNEEI